MQVNVDFRYSAGYPSWQDCLRYGIDWVRVISLPQMEGQAATYLDHGVKVLAVFTGESNDAGLYVMQNCSALQIGNEPFMGGAASWPTGGPDDFVAVWNHIVNVVVGDRHLPLVGPGIWTQDYGNWASIAWSLPRLSAAACHVYPDPSGHSDDDIWNMLDEYKRVRSDLPLICSEWTMRGDRLHNTTHTMSQFCSQAFWFAWGPGVPGHELYGTPEFEKLVLG